MFERTIVDIYVSDNFTENVAFIDLLNIKVQSYSLGIDYSNDNVAVNISDLEAPQIQIVPYQGIYFMPFDNNIVSFNIDGDLYGQVKFCLNNDASSIDGDRVYISIEDR